MKIAKLVLIGLGLILASLLAFLAVGVLVNVVWCLFLLGALYLIGVVVVKLLSACLQTKKVW